MKIYAAENLTTGEAVTSTSRRAIKNWVRLQKGRLIFSPRHETIRYILASDRKYYQ